ncbi:MAG: ABC transporter permease [Bacteroidales bacterium]
MIDRFLHDIRFALRTLARAPAFTAAVVITIALGVGATTSLFTVVDAILLQPLPFPASDRVYRLCETNASIGGHCGASPLNVADWARASRTLESAGVARTEPMIGQSADEKFSLRGAIASPGFFRVLRLEPALGRLIEDRDMPRGSNQVAVVSHAFWQTRLGGDRRVLGQSIVLDGKTFTIVGVLGPDAYFPDSYLQRAEVWKPLTASLDNVENRNWRGFVAIGRLSAGATAKSLGAELTTIRTQLERAYPEANANWGLRLVGIRESVVGEVRARLWIFLGVTALVLLIVCANVASLLLVRASRRTGEFAVRASLGAGRARLVQQLVTESLVLSLVGGGLGLLIASWATSLFVGLAPPAIPRLAEVGIDIRIVLFAFLLSAVTAVLFGTVPARQAAKTDLNRLLKGARAASAGDGRVRAALVVVEVALALMLLVAAGLLTRSFARLLAWDPGFDREGLVTVWMLPSQQAGSPVALMQRVRDEIASVPGVRGAGLTSAGPLFGGGPETGTLAIEGRAPFAPGNAPTIEFFDADPHYFATLGVRLLGGRGFTAEDRDGAPDVAVVNETFARRFFNGRDALGQRVTVAEHLAEIVGIVSDVRPLEPDRAVAPQIYWPIQQYRRGAAYLLIRTAPGATGIEKLVRARTASVSPDIQLTPMLSLDELFAKNIVSPRFNMLLVAAFALVAVLLAAVGVYGVMAYSVASRTREMGVHVALGATPGRLVATVLGQGMRLAGAGLVVGSLGALATGRLLSALLYGLPARDPVTLAGSVVGFALVALAACWLPARAASRADPVVALRAE